MTRNRTRGLPSKLGKLGDVHGDARLGSTLGKVSLLHRRYKPNRCLWVNVFWSDAFYELIMPLARPDLQTSRAPLVPRERKFSDSWSCALILGTLLFANLNSSRAQDADALPTGKSNPAYPGEAEITFQWSYSCPSNKACTFRCLGAGGAEHLTRLDIYLGTLPVNSNQQQRAPAIFYDFSSREFPHSNGFAISTGINALSCQVSGMTLDYSGPPKLAPPSISRSPLRPVRAGACGSLRRCRGRRPARGRCPGRAATHDRAG